MFRIFAVIFSFFCLFSPDLTKASCSDSFHKSHTKIKLTASEPALKPGRFVTLTLNWELEKPWHIDADPSEPSMHPKVNCELPAGISVDKITWSDPKDIISQNTKIIGHEQTFQTHIRLKISDNFKPSAQDKLNIKLRFTVCHNVCIVENPVFSLSFPTQIERTDRVSETTTTASTTVNVFDQKNHTLFSLIFLILTAFAGGVLLNLMPCVLPVLAFKLLSIIKLCEEKNGKKHLIKAVLAYTTGIILTFQILSVFIGIMRSAGYYIGWGFQLQSPVFISFLLSIFLAISLNLFGAFEFGLSLQIFGQKFASAFKPENRKTSSSFMNGVLTCLVATPCSAPFMGTAIAASLTEPIWVIILIFLFLGLGLSFPFLLLLIFPSFSKHLPRPGAWMITLRQFMGLLMIATVFWLLWVLSQQCEESLATILAALWCLGVGFWGYGLLNAPVKSALSRILAKLILFASVLISAHLFWNISKNDHQTLSTKSTIDDNTDTLVFEPYSEERINQALASDSPIIINFTAKWCLTCQISKKLALDTPEVKAKIKEKGIILFEADWTHHNELITKKLEFFNQNSIPFFVYYPGKNQPPVFLSTLFTKEEILELLK